jgi:hypothetical protein
VRRLLVLSSFYRGCCATGHLIGRVPTNGAARLVMDPARTELIMLRIDR